MDWLIGMVNLTVVCLRPTYDCKGIVMIGKVSSKGLYIVADVLAGTQYFRYKFQKLGTLFCPRLYM